MTCVFIHILAIVGVGCRGVIVKVIVKVNVENSFNISGLKKYLASSSSSTSPPDRPAAASAAAERNQRDGMRVDQTGLHHLSGRA